jgi:hypothetical protein
MLSAGIFLFFSLSCSFVASWEPLGAAMLPRGMSGSVVDMSEDGRRIAVGAPDGDGSVLLYELDFSGNAWNLLVEIRGNPDEGFGDALSLSPDGLLVAVRRHHVTPNAVSVYQIFRSHYHPIGPIVPCPDNGTEVNLGQATLDHHLGSEYYLLVSCEDFEDRRGMVQAYKLDSGTGNRSVKWIPFLPTLTGASPGDRFGFALALVEAPSALVAPGNTLRIAISSPYRASKRGAVQVFAADNSTSWRKIGNDLVGNQVGELFGSALAMSSTTQPYLVIGSPMKRLESEFNPHGMVQLFHWRSSAPGEMSTWQPVGAPLVGLSDRDSFGHAVAMTRDGGRLAATSVKHDSNRGYVMVFERKASDSWRLVGSPKYGTTHGKELGASVSLNSVGSVVAAVPLRGADVSSGTATVYTWVDENPFCQVPETVAYFDSNSSVLDAFLDRLTCRDGLDLIDDDDSCVSSRVFRNGQWQPCEWESRSFILSANPSENPSSSSQIEAIPTIGPSVVMSLTPSGSPHIPTPESYEETFIGISHLDQNSTARTTSVPTHTPSEREIPDIPLAAPYDDPIVSPGNSSEVPSQVPSDFYVRGIPYVRACRCNERNACISEPLSKGSDMNLCLRVLSSRYSFWGITQLVLEQRDFSLIMIQDYAQTTNQHIVQGCHGGMCTASFSPPSYLFGNGRPPIMEVAGRVALERQSFRRLRGLDSDQLHEVVNFRTTVTLDDPTESQVTREGTSSSEEKRLERVFTILLWFFLGLLGLIGLMSFFIYIVRAASKMSSST